MRNPYKVSYLAKYAVLHFVFLILTGMSCWAYDVKPSAWYSADGEWHQFGYGDLAIDPCETRRLSSGSYTWTAIPDKGQKVSYWLRAADLATGVRVNESNGKHVYPDSLTYTETFDKSVISEVQFGVRFDWITYQLEYHDDAQVVDRKTYSYTNRVSIISRTKTGQTFDGWKSADGTIFPAGRSCTGEAFNITNHDDNAVVKLTATWTTNSYVVSFNANGHGTDPAAMNVVWMQPYGTLPTMTCAGWAFDGWYTASEGGTKVEANSLMTTAGNTTLYARWTQLFTVVFKDDSRFGSGVISSFEVRKGGAASAPETPVHEGYAFDGWTGWNGFSNVEQDRIYTATYTANKYVLTYHSNGSGETSYGQDFTWHDSKALMANQFKRVGYVFAGWAYTANGEKVYGGTETVSGEAVAKNPNLFALWVPITYRVQFAANGGDGTMDEQTLTYDVETTLRPCSFVREGLEFKGWTAADGTRYDDGQKVLNLTDDASTPFVLTAVWSENYTLQFDANGATVTNEVMSPMTFADSKERKALPPVGYALPGYTFLGWATNREEAVAWKWSYADQAEVFGLGQPSETITFFATWTNNTYTVKFDGGEGASGSMADLTLVYDQPQTLPDLGFVREPSDIWAFVGWSNTVSGATYLTNGVDRVTVSNLTTEANGVVKLNAIWKSTLSELSLAMKCYNLQWESGLGHPVLKNDGDWSVLQGDNVGSNSNSCVHQDGAGRLAELFTSVSTNGVLKFWWKANVGTKLYVDSYNQNWGGLQNMCEKESSINDWNLIEIKVDSLAYPIEIVIGKEGTGESFIDWMTWTPEGTIVDPTDQDAVEISSVEMKDGVFNVTFVSDVRFDYNLLTNANLQVDGWGVMETKEGNGQAVTFKPTVLPDEPKMFYKVETIRKRK